MTSPDLALVIMAAGSGRRFGGLKQLTGFGPAGQTFIDYALHDALLAGVQRAVLVISREHGSLFQEGVVRPWAGRLPVDLVFQQLEDLPILPVGGPGPAHRDRPWGTGHAVWAVRQVVDGPFLVANADDFYGRPALAAVAAYLQAGHGGQAFALQGYDLLDTLPAEGGFSRGFCRVDTGGRLVEIQEHLEVKRSAVAGAGQLVSMNLWGFTPEIFPLLEEQFLAFLGGEGHDPIKEFYLPAAVQVGVTSGRCRVQVLPPVGTWFGVTSAEDAALVHQRLARLHREGVYPEDLRP